MEAPLTLAQMLSEMDEALAYEIKAQSSTKSSKRTAIDGKQLSEQNGLYLYEFSLPTPWEPQDDTPLSINIKGAKNIKGTIVTSTGTQITLSVDTPLPEEALQKIEISSDQTELTERLREALKKNKETEALLGSKSFGLIPFIQQQRQPSTNPSKIKLHERQLQAVHMVLGSEVTYVVGPPGTGKTTTLATMAYAYMREGRTVLIVAHTNIAVDNAIMKLAENCKHPNNEHGTELQNGQAIRYGATQHPQIKEQKYEEVYLPAIVRQRNHELHKRREELDVVLEQKKANWRPVTHIPQKG